MRTTIVLHELAGTKRAGELAILVENLLREGRRMVVWVGDEGRRRILDEYLWTFRKQAFIPHLDWSQELGEVDEPVVLVGEPVNPNRAQVLVVGDDVPSLDLVTRFEEVHDLIPPEPESERLRRLEHWREVETALAGDVRHAPTQEER